jgi:hypothetical protein
MAWTVEDDREFLDQQDSERGRRELELEAYKRFVELPVVHGLHCDCHMCRTFKERE